MVDRLQGRKIVIVDLDGTLIHGNSFHEFLKVCFKYSSLSNKLKFLHIFLLRLLKVLDHREMKFRILKFVAFNDKMQTEFKNGINKIINKKVEKILLQYREAGAEIWLATAAPDIYIPLIWKEKYIATATHGNRDETECKGENKVAAINKSLGSDDNIEAVFTDHYDDIPLLKMGAIKNVLVNPSQKTIERLNEAGIKYEMLN